MKQKEKVQLSEMVEKIQEGDRNTYKELQSLLEKIQQESFLEGYLYAIEVLKNGIVKKKTE